jgi:hypothetical protein
MLWYIERKLGRLRRLAEPDEQFLTNLERRLEIGNPRIPSTFLFKFRFAAVSVGALIIFLGTTSTYAYASDQVLPGTFLYPLRLGLESIESRAVVTEDAKVTTQIKHLERRLAEDKLVAQRSGKLPDARLEEFHSALDSIIDKAGQAPSDKSDGYDKSAARLAEKYIELTGNDASATRDLVGDKAQKLKDRLDKLNEKRKNTYANVRSKLNASGRR